MPDRSVKILLVEDNPDHVFLISRRLKNGLSCEVESANSAEEALSKLSSTVFDIIVSDYNLPEKSGLDILREIKEKNLDVPFIMLTGAGDEKIAVSAMHEGAYDYLVKDEQSFKILPRIVKDTLSRFEWSKVKERLEAEIREKNIALEEANRELRKLDELKSEFVASVTHEFRTPLNSISEVFSMIMEGVADPKTEQGKRVLHAAENSLERLTVLIDDLLDFSRLEAGKLRLNKASCEPKAIVTEAVGTMEALARKSGISLNYSVAPDLPKIYADRSRIIQVLTNLIDNAIKFTPQKGKIDIRVELADHRKIQFSVSDTGKGVPEVDLGRIFQRFEQVKDPSGTKTIGTGLGLSICKDIVKMHQGNIGVESSLGKGSKFYFVLPAYGSE